MEEVRPLISATCTVFQYLALVLLGICAALLAGATLLAAAGVITWPEIPVSLNGRPVDHGGAILQVGATILLLALCFLIPINRRVMNLEYAHRDFSISMEDVAHAYVQAHAADRAGIFQATAEFDAVKERINHLRKHPDLGRLEPDILEAAAKMSRISEDLARAFSDERIDRARDFLVQRQREVEMFQERLDHAKALHADIRQWANRVDLDEAIVRSQLEHLVEDLHEILPEMDIRGGPARSPKKGDGGVIHISKTALS